MNAKGYISADQASSDQIAVLKAQQALDQAKTRLDLAQATNGAVKPPTVPPPRESRGWHPATATTSTRRLFSDREPEPGRLDRLESRLDALERRIGALEHRPDSRPPIASDGSGPNGPDGRPPIATDGSGPRP